MEKSQANRESEEQSSVATNKSNNSVVETKILKDTWKTYSTHQAAGSMITKHDHVHRQTCADTTITDVIRHALADNFEHIPFTNVMPNIRASSSIGMNPLKTLKHHFVRASIR